MGEHPLFEYSESEPVDKSSTVSAPQNRKMKRRVRVVQRGVPSLRSAMGQAAAARQDIAAGRRRRHSLSSLLSST